MERKRLAPEGPSGSKRLWHVLKEANLNSGDLIASLQEEVDPQLKEGVYHE